MSRLIFSLALIVMLNACTTYAPPIPPGYQGPLAVMKDTVVVHSARKADFFYLSEINGQQVEDSRLKTLAMNYGQGMRMTPHVIERNIPAVLATFKIVGRTEYAAPILAILNPVYQVSGLVKFDPGEFKSYVVRGQLGENYSAVWIEEETTRKLVGDKIEIHGSASLGLFEK
jgi:hypothetical protein